MLEDDELDNFDVLVDSQPEKEAPDPEEMLKLLNSREGQQRSKGARAFCELKDSR